MNFKEALTSTFLGVTAGSDSTAVSFNVPYQNCFIFDYSVIAKGYLTDILPRRIGTLKIITNNRVCDIIDNYTELRVAGPEGTGIVFNAKIEFVGGTDPSNRVLRITFQNESGIEYKLQLFGRIWGTILDLVPTPEEQQTPTPSFFSSKPGPLYIAGGNNSFDLGQPSNTDDSSISTSLILVGSFSASVISGSYHWMAVTSGGNGWGWGDNTYGQLGLGPPATDTRTQLTQFVSDGSLMVASVGLQHSNILSIDKTIKSCGRNNYGQLGLGDNTDRNLFEAVDFGSNWISVNTGWNHNIGIKQDGTMWAWGRNNFGQLGLGDLTDRNAPVLVNSDTDWSLVSCGPDTTFAIKQDGTMWAWGNNDNGQLGLGDSNPYNSSRGYYTTKNRTVPTQVGTATDWFKVSTGGDGDTAVRKLFTIAIKTDGTMWACGDAFNSGTGSSRMLKSFTQISDDVKWNSISCGRISSAALKTDGTLWGWGRNSQGQLALNDQLDRQYPTLINRGVSWANVSVSCVDICAVWNDTNNAPPGL